MTQRSRHALQAAIVAAVIAGGVTLGLFISDKIEYPNDPIAYEPALYATIATFLTTFFIWKKLFWSCEHKLRRAVWVGAVIVVLSMIVMFYIMFIILAIIDPPNEFESLIGAILAPLGLGLIGSVATSPILIPIGIISAVIIRWFQLPKKD